MGLTVEDGRVVSIEPAAEGEHLPGRAIAPGFVNDHSHSFQYGLRGLVERVDPSHPQDDFWSWREQMYELAGGLDAESVREIAGRCFAEMLRAGYTSVTEFHYVHHRPDGTPYEEPNALADAVARAAAETGIRLLLLPVAYHRGGIPRFRDDSIGAFLERVGRLEDWASGRPNTEVGVAAHSVRAVPEGWLERLSEHARARGMALHIHADEQEREISECREEYGLRPVELLDRAGFLGPETTVVHATHADARELDLLAERGSSVCACPTTEGNLGDGFLPAEEILGRGIPLSIGSDQHVRIDPFEELRELETNARRLAGRRNVLVAAGESSPVPYLLRAGCGRGGLAPGASADFVEIDLQSPEISGVEPESLSAAMIFGGSAASVSATWVGGKPVYGRNYA